jgi:hypothetical protein
MGKLRHDGCLPAASDPLKEKRKWDSKESFLLRTQPNRKFLSRSQRGKNSIPAAVQIVGGIVLMREGVEKDVI